MLDPTKRFTTRVENYRKYRPTYPAEIFTLLTTECGLTTDSVIADVGSGTGLFTEGFLKNGNRVFGVEPNAGMRAAGEEALQNYSNFSSVDGTAEATTLPEQSVDFVVSAQAFHWFNPTETRKEFVRILKPGGWVTLVWNGFQIDTSVVTAAFHRIVVRYSTDYHQAIRELIDSEIESFFAHASYRKRTFENQQAFDFEGLKGRVLSMSYAPSPDSPQFTPLLTDLREVFEEHQREGKIVLSYETPVYYGQLGR